MKITSIGLGDIAQKAYLPTLSLFDDIALSLCTRNTHNLTKLGKHYQVSRLFSTIEDVIKNKPDAVMVHTNTASHYKIAKSCLQAGIAVFVDKPIGYELRQTEVLLNLSEQKDVPLMLGFNRRYAPAYQAPLAHRPLQLHYQKNRHDLLGNSTQFVYDDFIHIVDFAILASNCKTVPSVYVSTNWNHNTLAILEVHWQHDESLISLSMNRQAGRTCEKLEYSILNANWEINELVESTYHSDEESVSKLIDPWASTLQKRGFHAMVDHFIKVVERGRCDSLLNQKTWLTHAACDRILNKIECG